MPEHKAARTALDVSSDLPLEGTTSYLATCSGSDGTFTQRSSTTTLVVSGSSNGVSYVCSVVAENSIGSSEPSTQVSVTLEVAPSGLPIWLLYQATQ